MKIRLKTTDVWAAFVAICLMGTAFPGSASGQSDRNALPAWDPILSAVEDRYDVDGFSADFYQQSTIKALEITDTANGSIFVRRPNMMRWQYEKPFPKIFVTNGERLWVYLPEDNQVQIGRFDTYFGDGKGAGFLSDIKILRKKFDIRLGEQAEACCHVLALTPNRQVPEISEIRLYVSKSDYVISKIVILNVYGDENIIELINSQFGNKKDKSFFSFAIPEGADVIPID